MWAENGRRLAETIEKRPDLAALIRGVYMVKIWVLKISPIFTGPSIGWLSIYLPMCNEMWNEV